jgi:hypothetical protein
VVQYTYQHAHTALKQRASGPEQVPTLRAMTPHIPAPNTLPHPEQYWRPQVPKLLPGTPRGRIQGPLPGGRGVVALHEVHCCWFLLLECSQHPLVLVGAHRTEVQNSLNKD